MVIYKITNSINDKVYVGQTINDLHIRTNEHRYESIKNRRNLPLYNAMAKYGFDKFTFEVVDTASSIEELNKKEIDYIEQLGSLHPNGYNMDGGGNNKNTSLATRKKMSDAKKGKPLSEACRIASIKCHLGSKASKETKEKMRQANLGEKNPRFGKVGTMLGKHLTDGQKKKISKSKKGKKNLNLGLSKRKKIICLDTGVTYDSVKIAALALNITYSGIAMSAKGEINTHRGFRFKYL